MSTASGWAIIREWGERHSRLRGQHKWKCREGDMIAHLSVLTDMAPQPLNLVAWSGPCFCQQQQEASCFSGKNSTLGVSHKLSGLAYLAHPRLGKRALACIAKGLRPCRPKAKAKNQTKAQSTASVQLQLQFPLRLPEVPRPPRRLQSKGCLCLPM